MTRKQEAGGEIERQDAGFDGKQLGIKT